MLVLERCFEALIVVALIQGITGIRRGHQHLADGPKWLPKLDSNQRPAD